MVVSFLVNRQRTERLRKDTAGTAGSGQRCFSDFAKICLKFIKKGERETQVLDLFMKRWYNKTGSCSPVGGNILKGKI